MLGGHHGEFGKWLHSVQWREVAPLGAMAGSKWLLSVQWRENRWRTCFFFPNTLGATLEIPFLAWVERALVSVVENALSKFQNLARPFLT